MSSHPKSELPFHFSDRYIRIVGLFKTTTNCYIRRLHNTFHMCCDDRRSRLWTEGNSLFQFYRGRLDGANRPEKPTSAKASENRGTREPATWIYVSHKFMRLRGPFFRSRIPFANLPFSLFLSLSLLPASLTSFYPVAPALFSHRRIPAFRGFFPTHENESLLAAVSLLLIIK